MKTMAIVPVIKTGSEINEKLLATASEPINVNEFGTSELSKLIKNLIDTKAATEGVGIAAPQIGIHKRVIVVGFDAGNTRYAEKDPIPVIVIVNPVLEPMGDEKEKGEEGCLSVTGVRALIPRYKKVSCRGFDVNGQPLNFEADGFYARILQHECDHLDGQLFTSRVESEDDWLMRGAT
jgi:peptide deformylase